AEIQTALRHPADHARLRGQRHEAKYLFLRRDGRHSFRHPDPEIDHAAKRQLTRSPASDDFALVELHRLDPVQRNTKLPGEGRAVRSSVSLEVILRFSLHDTIDQDA